MIINSLKKEIAEKDEEIKILTLDMTKLYQHCIELSQVCRTFSITFNDVNVNGVNEYSMSSC